MANVSKNDPLKGVQAPEDEPRVLNTLGPDHEPDQPTELEIQDAQDAVDEDEKKKVKAAPKAKLFPIKLLKNYRPLTDNFRIVEPGNGKNDRDPSDEEKTRIDAGTSVLLPLDEAMRAIELKIGERNDPLPGK